MQEYFKNVKALAGSMKASATKAAKEVVAKVSAVASELKLPSSVTPAKKPHEELVELFCSVCQIMDEMGGEDDADSAEADAALYDSKARGNLKGMITILQIESDTWFGQYSEKPDPDVADLPCLNSFLETNVMHELSNRAVRDLPRGCLPLILGTTASLLRSVRYPLLPQVSWLVG